MESPFRGKARAYELFPHEKLIEAHKLDMGTFSASLTRKIHLFNRSYVDMYYDGTLDEKEQAELALFSEEIVKQIKKEFSIEDKKKDESGDAVLGLLGGVGLGILAFFGLKKLIK